jgi:hypothetical protein
LRKLRAECIVARNRIRMTCMKHTAATLLLIYGLGCMPADAAEPAIPVLDVTAVPYLTSKGRASYADFLLANLPRAVAVASNGACGWFGGATTIDNVRSRALKSCADKGGMDCAIYAEDLQVVWPGRTPAALPAVPGPQIEARDYAFSPDSRFIWYGPQAARGLFVWSHGKGGALDGRNLQPPPFVRAFNNAGFDVIRFGRNPSADYVDEAADWLRKGLATLRQKGWRTIVAGGQSRGAWNSLQVLDTPGLADAVIADSPASFSGQATQEAELYRILRADRSPAARVAVAQFHGDNFVRDMPARIAMLRDLLPSRASAVLVIDQPEGITGHGGAGTGDFARKFGPCLVRFVIDPVPPADCPFARVP